MIGITEMGNDPFCKYMKSKYQKRLELTGAKIKWLAWSSDVGILQSYLEKCDGILFPGGADIDPTLYGEVRTKECGEPHQERDAMEPILLRMAVEKKMPVFAICRGCQLINVAFGGTLYQDITKQYAGEEHDNYQGRALGCHFINVNPNSKLYKILQTNNLEVNSIHHQAIKDVSSGLFVSARTPSGCCEAVEIIDYPTFGIAVQWHPEHLSARYKSSQQLFNVFVSTAIEYHNR
jgi:putative glutamine amidotransferase